MDTVKITKSEEWTHPLFISLTNNKGEANLTKGSLREIMSQINRHANVLAKENANWHDDPNGDPEGHAAMHAPAHIQFPPEVRRAVAMELFEYFLTEGGSI